MERNLFRPQKPVPRTYGSKTTAAPADDGKKRVLLIDDNDDTLYLMRDMLERAGFDVDLADSGAEGILRFRRATPDLVLLDIEMPGMDGFEVCRRIREQDPTNRWHRGWRTNQYRQTTATHVPVVLLTGHASLDHVREAAQVGIDGYIVKSPKEEEILARIKQFLSDDDEQLSNREIDSYFKKKKDEKSAAPAKPLLDRPSPPAMAGHQMESSVKSAPPPVARTAPPDGATFPRGSGLVASNGVAILEETDPSTELAASPDEPFSRKTDELRGWLIQMFSSPEAAEPEIIDADVEYDRIMSTPSASSEPVTAKIREMTHRFGQRVTGLLGLASVPGECRIRILDGGLRVELDVEPPTGMGEVVTVKKVKDMLEEQRIVYGVDEAAIVKAVETGKSQKVYGACIVLGIPPEPGEDGKIVLAQNGASALRIP